MNYGWEGPNDSAVCHLGSAQESPAAAKAQCGKPVIPQQQTQILGCYLPEKP